MLNSNCFDLETWADMGKTDMRDMAGMNMCANSLKMDIAPPWMMGVEQSVKRNSGKTRNKSKNKRKPDEREMQEEN
jgi:hypothetical protein